MNSSGRRWMASFLVSLYPDAWRREYGDELEQLLLSRPMSAGTVNDVFWSAIGQRLRHLSPHVMLGLPTMAFFAAWCAVNVAVPDTMQNDWTALIHHTTKLQPSAVVYPFRSDAFALLLFACGAWTHKRLQLSPARCGLSAMLLTGYAGFPVMVLGTLMALGILALPGFTPLQVFATTFFQFGTSFIWGLVGGLAARWLATRRSVAV